jgi:multidrug efflux system outer membrane protein
MAGFSDAKEPTIIKPSSPAYKTWEEAAPTTVHAAIATTFNPAFPEKQWWTRFNDPYLNGYIAEAIQSNPGLQISLQRIQESRAQVTDALSKEFPTLSLNPGFTRVGLPNAPLGGFSLPSAIKFFLLTFQANYELDLFGRNWDQVKSTRKEEAATELDSRAYLIALEGEVAAAYFNLLRADSLVQTQTHNLELFTRIHALKQNQYDVGLVDNDEVIRANRDVALAQTSLTMYQQQQALFAHQLAVLVGRTPVSAEHLQRGNLDQLSLPSQTDVGLPAELVERRPDILASEKRLERAAIDVRVARKAFLPTINLGGQLTLASQRFQDVFNWDNKVDVQNVGIKQPLFQGGKLIAGVRFRQARQREQLENYRQTILTAFREVEDQLALLKSNYESLNSNTERLELTKDSLHIAEEQYQQGLIPHLNVLQSETNLAQYQQLIAQSKADAMIATVNLFKALGGGF